MAKTLSSCCLLLVAAGCLSTAIPVCCGSWIDQLVAGRNGARYAVGQEVPLWASKTGPFSNPSEAYDFYVLPFCKPEGIEYKTPTLGEALAHMRMASTPFNLPFRTDRRNEVLCETTISPDELAKVRQAIQDDWYVQFCYDDLPVWGFVGKTENVRKHGGSMHSRHYMFTHWLFDIAYNGSQVIEVNLSVDFMNKAHLNVTEVGSPVYVNFTYSVNWRPTIVSHTNRLQRYAYVAHTPHHMQVHWMSLLNSAMTVLLMAAWFATTLMCTIRKRKDNDEQLGWRALRGKVWHQPAGSTIMCAFLGIGTQVLAVAIMILVQGLMGRFHPHSRGSVPTSALVLYALTGCVAGYTACSVHRQLNTKAWRHTLMLVCFAYSGPLIIIFAVMQALAVAYGSTAALPSLMVVGMLLAWAVIAIPLTLLGGYIATRGSSAMELHKTSMSWPEIPRQRWYRRSVPQVLMAGVLPFSCMVVELYFVLASAFSHRSYIVWHIEVMAFTLLILTTALTAAAFTYFQLSAEDHRWQWRSFSCGGCAALYAYLYCCFYFFTKSGMRGLLQTAWFFGYNLVACFGLFLMLGAVGWGTSWLFVRQLYKITEEDTRANDPAA